MKKQSAQVSFFSSEHTKGVRLVVQATGLPESPQRFCLHDVTGCLGLEQQEALSPEIYHLRVDHSFSSCLLWHVSPHFYFPLPPLLLYQEGRGGPQPSSVETCVVLHPLLGQFVEYM